MVAPLSPYRHCLQTALRLLGRRDHGIQEIKDKLWRKGFSTATIESTLSECIRMDYLNDEKFTAKSVRRNINQGYGPQRIKQKLLSIGIAENLIASALTIHFNHEQQTVACRQVFKKKYKAESHQPDQTKIKAKLYRFLYARGFSPDIIRQVMSSELD